MSMPISSWPLCWSVMSQIQTDWGPLVATIQGNYKRYTSKYDVAQAHVAWCFQMMLLKSTRTTRLSWWFP
jgi:hypothetical protein